MPTPKARIRPDRVDRGDEEGGADSRGIEKVHVGDAAPEPSPRMTEELAPGSQHDWEGEGHEHPVLDKLGNEHGYYPHALERQDHDDCHQRPNDPHVPLLPPEFVRADLLLPVKLSPAFQSLRSLIAKGLDRLDHGPFLQHPRVTLHPCGPGAQTNGNAGHTWNSLHRALDFRHATGAAHAFDAKNEVGLLDLIAEGGHDCGQSSGGYLWRVV
jgi:hypothetical protein